MKRINLIAGAIALAVISCVSVSAQTDRPAAGTTPGNLPETKIAFITTERFGDEKTGITRYINAVKSLEREFQPQQTELNNLQTRIKGIADEITKLTGVSVVDPKTIQAKNEEGERLQNEAKRKREDADAAFKKRYGEVIDPISQDISKALEQFASQRGITVILDMSKLEPVVLAVNPAMDVTLSFIADYNSKHPATAPAAPR